MPTKLFRLLAAVLIALAVPVQGLAAAAAGVCMASGGHGAHAHGTIAQHHASADATQDHAAHSEGDPAGTAHCPPCVSCCAAVVIASTINLVLPEIRPLAAIAAPQHWIAGVLPDNPERPPLSL